MDIKLKININTDNSAFDDSGEARRIMDSITRYFSAHYEHLTEIELGNDHTIEAIGKPIMDINGNKIGEWNCVFISALRDSQGFIKAEDMTE
tara:strand:- start:269 stop:544 length:276 start_codon:yes stop_codon:yes gene_type:complete